MTPPESTMISLNAVGADENGIGGNSGESNWSNEAVEELAENETKNLNWFGSNFNGNENIDSVFSTANSHTSERSNNDEESTKMPPLQQDVLNNMMSNAADDEDIFGCEIKSVDDDEGGKKLDGAFHDVDWFKYENSNKFPLNGAGRPIRWHIWLAGGEIIPKGGDVNRSTISFICFLKSKQNMLSSKQVLI